MLPCYAFFLVILICLSAIVTLLLHHRAKHGNPDDHANFLQDPCDQWFQISDVCNFKTCSHEMWILFCLLVLTACCSWSVQVKCDWFSRTLLYKRYVVMWYPWIPAKDSHLANLLMHIMLYLCLRANIQLGLHHCVWRVLLIDITSIWLGPW